MRKASLILLVMFASSCMTAAETRDGWDQVPEILSRIVPPTFPNRDFNVSNYGAVGDGVTDC